MRLKDILNIKIGCKSFDIVKDESFDYSYKRMLRYNGVELRNIYTRYSQKKDNVYNNWLLWSVKNNCSYFGICGSNSMQFSLSMQSNNINIDNILYITKRYNKMLVTPEKWNELKTLVYEMKKLFIKTLNQYVNIRHDILYDYNCVKIFKQEGLLLVKEYEPKFEKILGGLKNNIPLNIVNAIGHDIFD